MASADLTIAIIAHHLRGYPADCVESLAPLPGGVELLLVQTEGAPLTVPNARTITVPREASRAAAKNLAVREARGELLLLATADTIARPGAVERLRKFLEAGARRTIASAQLLQENGMPRRTGFALPSVSREFSFPDWFRRQRYFSIHSRKPPVFGPPRRAEALHATFLMARRETFLSVGEFAEGYRFAFEDLEWCWRAKRMDIELYVCPEAAVFKIPPQLKGELSPETWLALEASQQRCLRATRGAGYAGFFRGVRAAKSLGIWLGAAGLNAILCGNSRLLAGEAAVHRAVFRMRADSAPSPEDLPPDIESCVRWETFV